MTVFTLTRRLPPIAAVLLAATTAHAADLPLKAKAVAYVRACSLYGAGYYYIPGTDTCIKLGGYVRYEAYHNAAGGNYPTTNPQGAMNRSTATLAMQARVRLSTDVRTETEYGTLRSYVVFGVNALNNNSGALDAGGPAIAIALERAFVQFAGFTFGRADTFFASYNSPAYSFLTFALDGSSGTTGLNVAAYTAELGNGFTATIALEDQMAHAAPVIDLGRGNAATSTAGVMGAGLFAQPAAPFSDIKGQWVPDIVGNIRVRQDWGGAQIKGALHRVGARYSLAPGNDPTTCVTPNTAACGHPDDVWGWAAGFGLTLKMPWDARDTISGVIAFAQGGSRYVAFSQNGNALRGASGFAFGPFNDAVFGGVGTSAGTQGDIHLTRASGGSIAFEHYWTPALRTSWAFGYLDISYSETAKVQIANLGRRCAMGGSAANAFNLQPARRGGAINCDPDWTAWRVASRTMWTPVANLDLGVEVGYSRVDTAFEGAGSIQPGAGNPNGTGFAQGSVAIADQGIWTATFRAQRSFWP